MRTLLQLVALALTAALAACSVHGVIFTEPQVTIGGTITGLDGTGLVLTNNGVDDLTISGNGTFAFATPLTQGASYAIALKSQPSSPMQMCSVTNGTGIAGDENVINVQVSCRTTAFSVGGSVTGLAGSGLVLQNNHGDDLPVNANGTFAFATSLSDGASYEVTVAMQPSQPAQVCTVTSGTGKLSGSNVMNVQVACVTSTFTIGGTVTGLLGAGLVLQDNAGDDLAISADGIFTFHTPIASGSTFAVTVRTQPAMPSQTCTVAGGTGLVGAGNVTSVAINCTTNRYTIGGTISGLAKPVTLQNSGGDDLIVAANGTFAFSTPVPSGATYDVTVRTQPINPWQTCTVAAGVGTVTNADVTSVVVTCTTNQYHIGGSVSGLATGNSVTIRNLNNGDELVLTGNVGFTFPTLVASGQGYRVTIVASSMPLISQTCTVTNGFDTVLDHDINIIFVMCTTNRFKIGGTVSGLTGAGLVLQTNRGDQAAITSNGAFTFPTSLPSGTSYIVTVQTQPSGQTCSVVNGAGTIGASNVTNVQVTCGNQNWSPSLFPITVPGSTFGVGDLALDNNGDLLVVVSNPARAIVRVNHVTGAQTTVAAGIGTSSFLLGIAYRAANDMIYTNTDDDKIFAVTPTGTVTPLATVSGNLNAITIAPPSFGSFGGFIIGVTQSGSVVAVDPANGAVSTITAAAGPASDLAFAPDGTLYISGATTVRTVTAAGAVATFATGFSSADGITITPDGARMFIADSCTETVRQVTIPGATVTSFGSATVDPGFFVGGILAAPGNTLIVMTRGSVTLIAFTY